MLIIGFCGVGKTTYVANHANAIDLTYIKPGLSALRKAVEKYEVVLGDPSWLEVFLESKLPFYVVVPTQERKDEYLANYRERYANGTGGGDDWFVDVISSHWDDWIGTLKMAPMPIVELEPGDWLEDAVSYLSQSRND